MGNSSINVSKAKVSQPQFTTNAQYKPSKHRWSIILALPTLIKLHQTWLAGKSPNKMEVKVKTIYITGG
jgi:hypothetical protein